VRDNGWLHTRRAIDKERSSQVARKLVNGITADIASVQVIVDLELAVCIQLLVEQLQEAAETAGIPSTPHSITPSSPEPLSVVEHGLGIPRPPWLLTGHVLAIG